MTHDKYCPLTTAPCCPHIPDCTCQCLCDWITEIRADERKQAAQRVIDTVGVHPTHMTEYDKVAGRGNT